MPKVSGKVAKKTGKSGKTGKVGGKPLKNKGKVGKPAKNISAKGKKVSKINSTKTKKTVKSVKNKKELSDVDVESIINKDIQKVMKKVKPGTDLSSDALSFLNDLVMDELMKKWFGLINIH